MKILLISDSHGAKNDVLHLVEKESPEKIFFLGDCLSDLSEVDKLFELDISMVKGNLDYYEDGVEDLILEIDGNRFFLTHGHKYYVKYNFYKLFLKAKEYEVDYVFFGHTHKYEDFTEEGIRFINPGSIKKPRGQKEKTYCLVVIEEKNIKIIKKVLT